MKNRTLTRVAVLVCAALLVCFAASAAGCGLGNDNSEDVELIQGEWQVDGSTMTVVIDDAQFNLPGDVSYDYTINTDDETISFGTGDLQGTATYVLSDDNQTLTLTETVSGEEVVTTFVKLSDDIDATPSIDSTASTDSSATADTTSTETSEDASATE